MENIGYIAAFLTTFAFLPQAVKTIRTRDTSGLSLLMYACMTVGIVCWLLHGLHLGDVALIAANSVTLFLALPILLITLSNTLAARRVAALSFPENAPSAENRPRSNILLRPAPAPACIWQTETPGGYSHACCRIP